jgi:hypothetical protein
LWFDVRKVGIAEETTDYFRDFLKPEQSLLGECPQVAFSSSNEITYTIE